MDKLQMEARIKEIKAEMEADSRYQALRTELADLEREYGKIRAMELLPELIRKHASNCNVDVIETLPKEALCVSEDEKRIEDKYRMEIYKGYDDEVPAQSVREIIEKEDPDSAYDNFIDEMYDPASDYYIDELVDAVMADLYELGIDCSGLDEHFVEDYFRGNLDLIYPDLRKQEVNVNIIIDSGDANYEFVLNSQYPGSAYNAFRPAQPGEEDYKPYNLDDVLSPEAGIVWLAETQGYNRQQLHEALLNDDIIPEDMRKKLASIKEPNPHMTFLQSMYWEMLNNPSASPAVTFLVKMTLGDLLKLNRLMKNSDRHFGLTAPNERPDCGTLVIGKETMTGLFDVINGGGSLLEIQLEKDVEIPINFIRGATPDINGCKGVPYCVGNVYGLCGDAWLDTVKEIKEPAKAEEKKEEE